jgi:AraC-like DNA-binding protein
MKSAPLDRCSVILHDDPSDMVQRQTVSTSKGSAVRKYAPQLKQNRETIEHIVTEHLRNPQLSVKYIAGQLNCSTRYLQKVFQGTGQSLIQYIRQRRLNLARTELLDPDRPEREITEIAFATGFSSAAHFSSAFRAYFGYSPSEARAHRSPEPLAPASVV